MRFSIVTPVYNSAPFLHACIRSVRAQSFSDWELLLVDDGSTDGSSLQLDRFAAEDRRLQVFHQQNSGQFYARQVGIRHARGEYLLFLDSDDELEPDCLRTINAALDSENTDILLYTGRTVSDGGETERYLGRVFTEKGILSADWLKQSLVSSNDLNSLCLKAIRRSLFDGDSTDYSAFKGVHCGEDKARLLYPVSRAKKILYIPDSLYRYNQYGESTMHRYDMAAVPRMMAGEMFLLLQQYMEMWHMNAADEQERYWVYYLRNFLSVYYNVRKHHKAKSEYGVFRRYPWADVMDQSALAYCGSRLLTTREKIKLLAAMLHL